MFFTPSNISELSLSTNENMSGDNVDIDQTDEEVIDVKALCFHFLLNRLFKLDCRG